MWRELQQELAGPASTATAGGRRRYCTDLGYKVMEMLDRLDEGNAATAPAYRG